MPQASDLSPSKPQTPTTRKSLLTRISSPFAPKSRTVTEFTVQAHDPHRKYSPGDAVKGTVLLKLAKAIRVTHIVICLHGFVQVYKTPGVPPAEGFRAHNNLIGKGKGNRKGAYFGNGFATLFEDEQVICGDGRLEEGNYKFEFEMRFPDEALPSSIEFERGTVTYMVTATLTRPTSMTPVVYHDQKISLAERIDIAKLLPPKPRTISLEPLLKRAHTKSPSMKRTTGSEGTMRVDDSSTRDVRSPARSVVSGAGDPTARRSSSPSAHSEVSQRSSGPTTSVTGSCVRSSRASDSGSALQVSKGKDRQSRVITATVESLRGGTLRGETIPLRISVSHTKHIKSMQGIIVTLYRQARVDTHPALPIGPSTEGEKRKFEDYYPKSLTGLGGLSLSGAGSSHMFRKDLAQITVPLIVDPTSLTAELNPKLRVPDDVFPTIACVPGAMISFKYYLEVVIDIQGKRPGSDRYFQLSGSNYGDPSGSVEVQGVNSSDSPKTPPAVRYVDTTAIRRDKSVVTCVLEIVVGTMDSERKKDKQRALTEQELTRHNSQRRDIETVAEDIQPANGAAWEDYYPTHDQEGYPGYDAYYPRHESYDQAYGDEYYNVDYNEASMEFEPPPSAFDDAITEKERLRRAEVALLPSAPPGAGVASGSEGANVPSAAALDEWYDSHTNGSTAIAGSADGHGSYRENSVAHTAAGGQITAPRYSTIEMHGGPDAALAGRATMHVPEAAGLNAEESGESSALPTNGARSCDVASDEDLPLYQR